MPSSEGSGSRPLGNTGDIAGRNVKWEKEGQKFSSIEGLFDERGNFLNNQEFVKVKYNSGDIYVGEWKNGVGTFGTLVKKSGKTYQGELKADHIVRGILTSPDGRWRYEGSFVDDKLQGLGKMTVPDGTLYLGQFNKGELIKDQELVKVEYPSGDTYVGAWKEGRPFRGRLIKASGHIYEGKFTADRFVGSLTLPGAKKSYNGVFSYSGEDKKLTIIGAYTMRLDGVIGPDGREGVFTGEFINGKPVKGSWEDYSLGWTVLVSYDKEGNCSVDKRQGFEEV